MEMTLEELKTKLEKEVKDGCWADDPEFAICDYACGNIDDAYWGGDTTGRVQLARELLKLMES